MRATHTRALHALKVDSRVLPLIERRSYAPHEMMGGTIGERIRMYRAETGLSQAQLARALGVKPISAWRWETGRIVPPVWRLRLISEVLGIPISALLDN